ncbi:MAG: hypothetical protein EOP02_15975, partial [Proteobacteria bacterium]
MNWLKSSSAAWLLSWAVCAMASQPFVVPPMVTIPAGQFTMGNNTTGEFKVSPSPAHRVSVKGFQLSPYEVTVGEFGQFVSDTKHPTKSQCWTRKPGTNEIQMEAGSWNSPKYAPSEFHPVMCIGPVDAAAYIAW